MGRETVFERVTADLAQGHTHKAVSRLAGWLSMHPTDLVARERLAEVHTLTGNWAEAGRWGYFAEVPDERAMRAFEKAFGTPAERRRALRWPDVPVDRMPPIVADRLAALELTPVRAKVARDRARRREPGGEGCLALLMLALVVVGVWTLLGWLF